MKLDILITHYKEPMDVVMPLLESINGQRNVDFNDINVVIANDGDECILDIAELQFFKFKVKYISQEKSTVSAVRNLAYSESDGDYVMFCDCDDCFHHLYGLSLMFLNFDGVNDVVATPFLEELLTKDGMKLVRHDRDCTFIHGKAFRRKFLDDKGIRFNEELSLHEDGFFVSLARTLAEKDVETKETIYSWCWNPNSVVRSRDDFVLNTYEHLVKARTASTEEYIRRNEKKFTEDVVARTIFEAYFETCGKITDTQRLRILRSVAPYWKKYGKILTSANARRMAEIFHACRTLAYRKGMNIEQTTFANFCKALEVKR